MKRSFFVTILSLGVSVNLAFAGVGKKNAIEEVPEAPVSKTWSESKLALSKLAEKFKNKKMTEAEKVKLLPNSNYLLFDATEFKLDSKQQEERAKVIVNFISATIKTDFANSNTDTTYEDYKANKKAYLAEIEKISDKKIKDMIIDAYDSWEKAEKNVDKPQPEGSSSSDVE